VSIKVWLRRLGAGWLLLWASLALAHPMPESQVWIDTTPGGMRLTAQLPLNRLEFSFGRNLTAEPGTVLARYGDALASYLLMHVGARSGGVGWQVLRPTLQVAGSGPMAELQASFEMRAPPGTDLRSPELLYDIITHEVRTHRVQVFLRNDWQGGFVGQAPLLLGEMRYGQASLPLSFASAVPGASMWRLFREGVGHIAAGSDHLLFLLMLMLAIPMAAPLAAAGGRWRGLRPHGQTVRHTAAVITAFTLGHSATLVLGSTGLLAVPAQPVEVAVAVTIALAALHAWRPPLGPRYARAEAWMALCFGLVHGMAFSASLSGAGLSAWQHAQALFAFNLGIETMQLIALALVLPPLLMLGGARPALLAALRQGLAAVAGLVALAWIAGRLAWVDLDGVRWLGDGGAVPLLLVAGLWLAALLSLGAARLRAHA
jgi:hypothetical protein